jgi:hypothetical protein
MGMLAKFSRVLGGRLPFETDATDQLNYGTWSWLDSCVLGDLRTLISGIDAYYASDTHVDSNGRRIGSGNFLLMAGCCAAIEYFGYILNDATN